MLAATALMGLWTTAGERRARAENKDDHLMEPGLPFFSPVLQGAQDAAQQKEADVDIQYANKDQVTRTTSPRPHRQQG